MSDRRARTRILRSRLLKLVIGYLAIALVANLSMLAGVGIARATGHNIQARDADLPDIKHLRQVDSRVWAGAQPTAQDYRELTDMGVTQVIDLRTGEPADPRDDDPVLLRELGADYEWLPITDGRTPDVSTVQRIVELVEQADGLVYVHCGAGVGRSMSVQAAYAAALGAYPKLIDHLSIGPPTVEQAWFIYRIGPGEPVRDNLVVSFASRFVFDAPRTIYNWVRGRVLGMD